MLEEKKNMATNDMTDQDSHEWHFYDLSGNNLDLNFVCIEAREIVSKIRHYLQDITYILDAREADGTVKIEDDLLYVARKRALEDLNCIAELADGLSLAVKQFSAICKAKGTEE